MDHDSILRPALQDLSDAQSDFRYGQFQNALNLLKRVLVILDEEPLAGFLIAVLPTVDFKKWWQTAETTDGSMVGSGTLEWPLSRGERVSMQLALCRSIAAGEIDLLGFTNDYCYPGVNNLDAHIREFEGQILSPLVRDIERLTETRPVPPVLFEAMGRLPESGDARLDALLREATQKFRDPAPAARREAVERLWDAWERLKSLDHAANKRISVDLLLARSTSEPAFLELLKAEARALTDIGNNFEIRHFEVNRAAIAAPEHHEYLFHRLYALMHLLLFSRTDSAIG